jgi:hypothetical protein
MRVAVQNVGALTARGRRLRAGTHRERGAESPQYQRVNEIRMPPTLWTAHGPGW